MGRNRYEEVWEPPQVALNRLRSEFENIATVQCEHVGQHRYGDFFLSDEVEDWIDQHVKGEWGYVFDERNRSVVFGFESTVEGVHFKVRWALGR